IGVRGGRASSNGSGEDAHLRAVVVELEAQEVGRRLLDDDALLLKPEGERRVELRLDGEVLLGRRLKKRGERVSGGPERVRLPARDRDLDARIGRAGSDHADVAVAARIDERPATEREV